MIQKLGMLIGGYRSVGALLACFGLTTSLPAGNAAYLQPLCLPSRKKSHCQRKMMMKMNAQSSTDLRQKFAIGVYSVPGNVITDQ